MEILFIILFVAALVLVWRLVRGRSTSTQVALPPQPASRLPREPRVGDDSNPTSSAIEPKIDVRITVSSSGSVPSRYYPDVGPLTELRDGGWVLNPKASFALTLDGVDRQGAEEFRTSLEAMWESGPYNQRHAVAELITRTDARVREIETYVATFRPKYQASIGCQRQESAEWPVVSEKDRDDLLVGFREKAIDALDVRPNCDLLVLFEWTPVDTNLERSFIARYGLEAAKLYIYLAGKREKIHVISADHRDRPIFEKLATMGLATRGQDIPTASLLAPLTLREMTEIAADTNPPAFRRKAAAIEFLESLPDIRDRLGKCLAFRELFQLCPLPPEFAALDLAEAVRAWQYREQIALVLVSTYWAAGWDAHNAERFAHDGYNFIRGWTLARAAECCPSCQGKARIRFERNQRPRVPLHVGCTCRVDVVTTDAEGGG